MTIERLGTFFKTHLATDYPSVCNTLTNLAFAPLQHLIGQKNYQSLNGRVYDLSTAPPQAPATLLRPAWKTIVVIAAFFLAIPLTLCGILTRHLSFFSKDINVNYWTIRLLPLGAIERSILLKKFDSSLLAAVKKQLQALDKQMTFDAHFTSAIACLEEFNSQLPGKDKTAAADLLGKASRKSTYPFPFQLAENLKTVELRQIPNPDLLAQFEDLHQSCQKQLVAVQLVLSDAAVNIRIANQVIKAANQNNQFFLELKEDLENLGIATPVIAAKLTAKKEAEGYCFPFYTQPLLLDLMKTIDPSQHKPLKANYSLCMGIVKQNLDILSPNEKPPEHHSSLLVIEQMKNISRLESMYQKLLETT
jgi:hypothetical protein